MANEYICFRKCVWFITLFLCFSGYGQGAGRKMEKKYFKGAEGDLETAIRADDRTAIAAALRAGADVNARGTHNITPLMIAIDELKPKAVAELLGKGANPNLKADDETGAVSLAVENYRESPEILFALMKAGGDPNTRRPDNDPVIKRFLNDRNCEFIRHMKNWGADLNIVTRSGDPIITVAGLVDDWDVVWCLIELGAKYDYELTSRSPLSNSLASQMPSPDSPIFPYKKKVWTFLKEHGIRVLPLKE